MNRQLPARSCCTTSAAMCLWAAAFIVIYVAGLLLRSFWPPLQPFGDTLVLLSLSAACFINFTRTRTLHCGITGPLFAVGGLAAALIEAGVWQFDMTVVWAVVLVGVGIAFVVEWRTVGQANRPDACNPGRS
jgi:hypothetical protein